MTTLETLTYQYTDRPKIERLYSSVAVANQTNDVTGTNLSTLVWADIVGDVTTLIDSYCAVWYNPSDLATSYWVQTRAQWLGAWILSQRRGNTERFAKRVEMFMEELERVRLGVLQIPNLPTRADFTPAMSNVYVDSYAGIHKIKVIQSISTGGFGSRQETSWFFQNDWF